MTIADLTPDFLASNAAVGITEHSPLVSREKRAFALRAARDGRQDFSASDQERAASNLHLLLEEVSRDRGLSKREIALAADLGGTEKTDSTKRLDTYTLPSGSSDARKSRLAKKPGKYLEIAEAVAILLNEPPAPFICQVFEGCTFGSDRAFVTSLDEEKWVRLAHQIQLMSEAVAQLTNVHRYWEDVLQRNGHYDFRADQLVSSANAIDVVGCSTGLSGYTAFPSDLPPIPSVLLGTRLLPEQGRGKLKFSDGNEIEVHCDLELEVRLALAPVGRTGEPGPMLEFRSRLYAKGTSQPEIEINGAYLQEDDGRYIIRGADISGLGDDSAIIEGLDTPEAIYRYFCGHDYRTWEEISPGLLQEIFGDWNTPLRSTYHPSDGEVMPQSRFEGGLAAHFLNAHLFSNVLESELADACISRATMLDRFCDQVDEQILKAEADAYNRWQNMRAS